MSGKRPFLVAAFLGLATIAFSLFLNTVFPKSAAKMRGGFTSPVLAFEFVQNEKEVVDLFNYTSHEERERFREQMDRGNYYDFIFMFLYNGFLFLLGWTMYKLTSEKIFLAILPLAVAAFAGDLLENLQLLKLSERVEEGDLGPAIVLLQWFTWLKWGALALIMALLGKWLIRGNMWMKALSLIGFAVPVLAVLAFFNPGKLSEIFSLGIGLMFLGMTILGFLYKK